MDRRAFIGVAAGGLLAAPHIVRAQPAGKGARAAGLPIEQPTNFDLVMNLRTAHVLGLTLSPSLLARAGQMIQ